MHDTARTELLALLCPFCGIFASSHCNASKRCSTFSHPLGCACKAAIARSVTNHGRLSPIPALICTSYRHFAPIPPSQPAVAIHHFHITSLVLSGWPPATQLLSCLQMTSICKTSSTLIMQQPHLRLRNGTHIQQIPSRLPPSLTPSKHVVVTRSSSLLFCCPLSCLCFYAYSQNTVRASLFALSQP